MDIGWESTGERQNFQVATRYSSGCRLRGLSSRTPLPFPSRLSRTNLVIKAESTPSDVVAGENGSILMKLNRVEKKSFSQ